MFLFRNQLVSGALMGAVLPIFGGMVIYFVTHAMAENYVIGTPDRPWIGFKDSTIVLMALCLNLIPASMANKRYMDNYIRGMMFPTVIGAAIWFFYYGRALFSSF